VACFVAVCNCAVHKKCHDKILGRCTGTAKDSRETKVEMTSIYYITLFVVHCIFCRTEASLDMLCLSLVMSDKGCLFITHSFEANSSNIAMNYILSKTRVFGLHFCCKQCVFASTMQFDVAGSEIYHFMVKKCRRMVIMGHNAVQGHTRSPSLVVVPTESSYTTSY